MANIKNKSNNKKLRKRDEALNKAVEAKTTWLSEDFKNVLREVSGQNQANETPIGSSKQKEAVKGFSRTVVAKISSITSLEG